MTIKPKLLPDELRLLRRNPVRFARVHELRQQIAAGTYESDDKSLAAVTALLADWTMLAKQQRRRRAA